MNLSEFWSVLVVGFSIVEFWFGDQILDGWILVVEFRWIFGSILAIDFGYLLQIAKEFDRISYFNFH